MMPVYSVTKMPTFLEEAVSSGWDVLGTVGSHHEAPRREVVSCYDYVPKKPTILLLGKVANVMETHAIQRFLNVIHSDWLANTHWNCTFVNYNVTLPRS